MDYSTTTSCFNRFVSQYTATHLETKVSVIIQHTHVAAVCRLDCVLTPWVVKIIISDLFRPSVMYESEPKFLYNYYDLEKKIINSAVQGV